MKDWIANVETWLQNLIERTLERLAGGRIRAASLGAAITRAMETSLRHDRAKRPWAADAYEFHIHPEDLQILLDETPDLQAILEQTVLQATRDGGYSLASAPNVDWVTDAELQRNDIRVEARHSRPPLEHTQQMPVLRQKDLPRGAVSGVLVNVDGRAYALDREEVSIGRLPDNHIVLSDPRVSRRHAQVRLREGRHVVFDMGSMAGTRVNGRPIMDCVLEHGDVITLAGNRLEYRIHAATQSPAQPKTKEKPEEDET
ncbi:MAG: DUF3662 domain-containing protein [Anaerolineales bacterium]|jgi:hypothetical protein